MGVVMTCSYCGKPVEWLYTRAISEELKLLYVPGYLTGLIERGLVECRECIENDRLTVFSGKEGRECVKLS